MYPVRVKAAIKVINVSCFFSKWAPSLLKGGGACAKGVDNAEHDYLIGLLQKEFTKALAYYKPRVQFPSRVIVELTDRSSLMKLKLTEVGLITVVYPGILSPS